MRRKRLINLNNIIFLFLFLGFSSAVCAKEGKGESKKIEVLFDGKIYASLEEYHESRKNQLKYDHEVYEDEYKDEGKFIENVRAEMEEKMDELLNNELPKEKKSKDMIIDSKDVPKEETLATASELQEMREILTDYRNQTKGYIQVPSFDPEKVKTIIIKPKEGKEKVE